MEITELMLPKQQWIWTGWQS